MLKTFLSSQLTLAFITIASFLSPSAATWAQPKQPECSNYIVNPNSNQSQCFSPQKNTVANKSSNLLNNQVYNYALSKLGQKVGDGECAYLAYEALKVANAKTLQQLGPTGPNADYVWGKLVVSLSPSSRSTAKIMPGDIIQFRNVSTYKKVTSPDGSWRSWTENFPHHTAIVASVSGNKIKLLQQNVGNNPKTQKIVQWGLIDLDSLQSGTMWVYRPTPS